MENKKVILERHKITKYTVNFEGKAYIWAGSKGNMISKKEVPVDLYQYLAMFTTCLQNGELILVTKTEEDKELLEDIPQKEEYEANALTKEEVKKILGGQLNKMKSELKKITSRTTKNFVLDVAKEIGLENANKRIFIKEWLGTELSTDELFK